MLGYGRVVGWGRLLGIVWGRLEIRVWYGLGCEVELGFMVGRDRVWVR